MKPLLIIVLVAFLVVLMATDSYCAGPVTRWETENLPERDGKRETFHYANGCSFGTGGNGYNTATLDGSKTLVECKNYCFTYVAGSSSNRLNSCSHLAWKPDAPNGTNGACRVYYATLGSGSKSLSATLYTTDNTDRPWYVAGMMCGFINGRSQQSPA